MKALLTDTRNLASGVHISPDFNRIRVTSTANWIVEEWRSRSDLFTENFRMIVRIICSSYQLSIHVRHRTVRFPFRRRRHRAVHATWSPDYVDKRSNLREREHALDRSYTYRSYSSVVCRQTLDFCSRGIERVDEDDRSLDCDRAPVDWCVWEVGWHEEECHNHRTERDLMNAERRGQVDARYSHLSAFDHRRTWDFEKHEQHRLAKHVRHWEVHSSERIASAIRSLSLIKSNVLEEHNGLWPAKIPVQRLDLSHQFTFTASLRKYESLRLLTNALSRDDLPKRLFKKESHAQ